MYFNQLTFSCFNQLTFSCFNQFTFSCFNHFTFLCFQLYRSSLKLQECPLVSLTHNRKTWKSTLECGLDCDENSNTNTGTPITSGNRFCDTAYTKFGGHFLLTGSDPYIATPTSAKHCARMCTNAVNAINADRLTNGETKLTPWTNSNGERAMSYVVFERFDIRVLN